MLEMSFHIKKCNAMFPHFVKVGNIRYLVTNYFILKVQIYCLRLTWDCLNKVYVYVFFPLGNTNTVYK